ncbi:MAG TPA: helix-turn-helix transcriptional regulator, partial [Segetibacter sp.]
LQLVAQHFEEERSVGYFAELLHVTPKHLSETIKEVTGKTAGKLIDQAVITQAKVLLRNPAMNIGEVATALHFSDQSFFGKFFKKHVGLSPIKYRLEL